MNQSFKWPLRSNCSKLIKVAIRRLEPNCKTLDARPGRAGLQDLGEGGVEGGAAEATGYDRAVRSK